MTSVLDRMNWPRIILHVATRVHDSRNQFNVGRISEAWSDSFCDNSPPHDETELSDYAAGRPIRPTGLLPGPCCVHVNLEGRTGSGPCTNAA